MTSANLLSSAPLALLATAVAVGGLVGLAPALGSAAFLALALLGVAFASQEAGLALLLGSMLLSPEITVGSGGGDGLETGRAATLRLDDLVLVSLCAGWWCRLAVERRLRVRLPARIVAPAAAYLAVCAAATALGMAQGRVGFIGLLFVVKYAEYFTVFLVALGPLQDPRRCRRLLLLFLGVAAVVAVVGLAQVGQGGRISTPFEGDAEPNTLGAYLVLAGALAAGLWAEGARPLPRVAPWLLALFFPTLLFTLSRSAWLATVVAALALLALARRRLAVAAVLAGALAIAPFVVPTKAVDRVLYTVHQQSSQYQAEVGGVRLDSSTSERLLGWGQVLRGWTRRPLLGHGVTGFPFVDAQYFKLLADTGLLGLGTFLWFLGALAWEAAQALARARTPWGRGVALGFAAAWLALVVHALTANTFIIVRVMEPFCFLAAALVAGVPAFEAEGAAS